MSSIPFEDDTLSPSAARFEAEQLDIWGRGIRMGELHVVDGRVVHVSATLPESQHARLKAEALRRDCSMASIVRQALQEWFSLHGQAL